MQIKHVHARARSLQLHLGMACAVRATVRLVAGAAPLTCGLAYASEGLAHQSAEAHRLRLARMHGKLAGTGMAWVPVHTSSTHLQHMPSPVISHFARPYLNSHKREFHLVPAALAPQH